MNIIANLFSFGEFLAKLFDHIEIIFNDKLFGLLTEVFGHLFDQRSDLDAFVTQYCDLNQRFL